LIAATVSDVLATEEWRGRQVPALLDPSDDRDLLIAAHERAAVGLGGVGPDTQLAVARRSIAEVADRFLSLGIAIDVPR
jgi:hypothetical protein